MKLKILFTMTLLVTLVAGCTANTDSIDPTTSGESMSSDQTLAYSTYMAGAFLSSAPADTTTSSTEGTVMNLATAPEDEAMLKIEERLGEASEYFNRLKVFLDNGMENPFTIEQDLEVEGDYDITMRYTVEEKTYTILLNEDEEGNLSGILILDGVEYEVEGYREVDTEYEDDDEDEDMDEDEDLDDDEATDDEASNDDENIEDEDNTGNNTIEETEEEIYLKTIDKEGSDNYVEITIETEDEHGEYEFEMELISYVDGVEKVLNIEFEVENDEVSIELETEDGNTYEFSRATENNGEDIDYEFEYEIDGVEGEVELTVTFDEQGNKVYQYHIEEDGQEKDIEEVEDDDDDEDDDEDDEDDDEEDLDDDSDDDDDEEATA